ncbi:MAG: zinc-dependent metalloprotease, partial [Maribacter sp.]
QPEDEGVALMPDIGVYDKYAIQWGYKPILDKSAEEEKTTLDSWILKHAGDPLYRFGNQQVGDVVDPSSQTEDLGDDAVKASLYGIANLKRIVPKLIEWTKEDGKDYDDLEILYGQVVSQFNRYMGHVSNNIGGVYEYHKTYEQEGAVYTPVAKEHQAKCMLFLQEELFQTPVWMLDHDIFGKIQYSGFVERVRSIQVLTLNNILSLGKMARLIENETANGTDAYSLIEMMSDLRKGIWSELPSGRKIDTYRRNLQKAHIDRLAYLMTAENQAKKTNFRGSRKSTAVNTSQSDIRSLARAELNTLKRSIRNATTRISDKMSTYHLQDAVERIDMILDPK